MTVDWPLEKSETILERVLEISVNLSVHSKWIDEILLMSLEWCHKELDVGWLLERCEGCHDMSLIFEALNPCSDSVAYFLDS